MHTFKVGYFWLVTSLHQCLEAGTNERGDATAEDGLFSKEIGLGFFCNGGAEHSRAGAADGAGIG